MFDYIIFEFEVNNIFKTLKFKPSCKEYPFCSHDSVSSSNGMSVRNVKESYKQALS